LRASTPQGRELWTVLLLLLAAVLVPTAGVLWFMVEAMGNLEASVRESLEKVYRGHLARAREGVDGYWEERVEALVGVKVEKGAAAEFARLVSTGACDSAIIYDGSGKILYPAGAVGEREASKGERWRKARRLEFEEGDAVGAAEVYGKIAEEAEDAETAARALLGRARCLGKVGEREGALEILTVTLSATEYRDAKDAQGRFVVPNSQLLALEMMGAEHEGFMKVAEGLAKRLRDYGEPAMPSSQRRFVMVRVRELSRERMVFSTLAAEELAGEYLESGGGRPKVSGLVRSPAAEVWQMSPEGSAAVGLFEEERIQVAMTRLVEAEMDVPDARVRLLPAGTDEGDPGPFVSVPAGRYVPGWRLALYLGRSDPFGAAAKRQAAVYLWGGVLVIFVITVPAVLVARYVGRQIKLTGLRNNLIATVSHELKTPLSSMRVLVDTLLEGRYRNSEQAREYLELIARENVRLSRLIDNFLTFSRMERNKRAFQFEPLSAEAVVNEAVEAVSERFDSGGFKLDVDVKKGLPSVKGDRDALVTVLVNLLDNAYKYSSDDKRVNAFYQVDRRLSRRGGGTGLGLSIVRFIVTAHDGTIDVWSEPEKGSRFTVKLPIARTVEPGER